MRHLPMAIVAMTLSAGVCFSDDRPIFDLNNSGPQGPISLIDAYVLAPVPQGAVIIMQFNNVELWSPGHVFRKPNITIKSLDPDDPDVVALTVLAGDNDIALHVDASTAENFELIGVTVWGLGETAILMSHPSDEDGFPGRISQCVIRSSKGIGIDDWNGTIQDSEIIFHGSHGLRNFRGQMARCQIRGNSGNGIDGSSGRITNSLIGANGGSGLTNFSGISINNTIVNNHEFGIVANPGSRVMNTIIWGNAQGLGGTDIASEFSLIQDYNGDEPGMLASDPLFVDSSLSNFRLSIDSPAIDAGRNVRSFPDAVIDLDGNPRPQATFSDEERGDGSFFDIGAYEFKGEFIPSRIETWLIE